MRAELEPFFQRAYQAFNARDIDTAVSLMRPDVEWANGMEGGHVYGREGVRDYWTRQWKIIDPHVSPQRIDVAQDGRVSVEVRLVVRDLSGGVLSEKNVRHVYRMKDGLIARMDIQERP